MIMQQVVNATEVCKNWSLFCNNLVRRGPFGWCFSS